MTFALMMSDYLSRQVINAIFPFLKADWGLSDTQLGSLVSVVALTVGLMSVPIALMADRIGRVKSATLMALVWGSATIACGLSEGFIMLLVSRALVGLGEAGYASAGSAILVSVFPARLHATVIGTFLAAGMIGSVLGVMLGGVLAQHLGWQMAFILVGGFGLALAIAFPMVVKEPAKTASHEEDQPIALGRLFKGLFGTPTFVFTFLAGGFGMFVQGSMLAWIPSYLNRYYGLEPSTAGMASGALVLCAGVGMIIGGRLVDLFSVRNKVNRLRISMAYGLFSAVTFLLAFSCPPGWLQIVLIGLGLTLCTSFVGPASAVIIDITPRSIHATSFAVLALSYSLIGLAPGPFLTGWLGDLTELSTALQVVPVAGLISALFFFLASRTYHKDTERTPYSRYQPAAEGV
ncbi:MFS transporter [Pseudomonas sp. N040]|uniref:MFS transporter n=1 Tax=Pseudomonas sp. N040 TaxID=2785325 RepID=UPI0018A302B8|nr:MFS transporter [Pseudomonas sp. N040]MBF7729056.1 MFS transporter [Pseudomonas sp. N040]MBW7012696.1 MFS transporter [Pseudomonas sp. N040]